jgi:hypothetical protein
MGKKCSICKSIQSIFGEELIQMKKTSIILLFLITAIFSFGQSEAVSPIYSFNIKKKIEPPIIDFVAGTLKFVDADGNNAIDGNETCIIEFDLVNSGTGDGLQLRAILKAKGSISGVQFISDQKIDDLPKSKTGRYSLNIQSGMTTVDGNIDFELEIAEPNGFNSQIMALNVITKKFLAPNVLIADHTIFSNDGSTNLSVRKSFTLQMLIQNTGQGDAQDVKYNLMLPENVYLMKGEQNGIIGDMAAGETRSLEFEIIMNAKYEGTQLAIHLDVSESLNKYASDWDGTFTLNQALASEKLVVQAKADEFRTIEMASLRSDVDKDIPLGKSKSLKRYALVVGNEDYSKYQPGLEKEVNVDFAANDARVFAEYAEKTLGVPKENITLIIDATKGQMSQSIAKLQRLIEVERGEAEVYFYYSGHGLPEESTNTPYLIPVDVSGTQPTNGIALQSVYASLAKYPTKKSIVILDACFSGGARAKELVAMKSVRVSADVSSVPGNLVVLASSSGTEASAVYRDKQHGYFSYFLFKQLKETKGEMTLKGDMNIIEQNVAREAARIGKIQTPTVLIGDALGAIWEGLTW